MAERCIAEITRAVAAKMRGYAVDVLYGEERLARPVITRNLIEFRELGGETIEVANVSRSGARPIVGWRWRSVEVVIEARSDKGGATEHDHKGAVDDLLEPLWVALISVTEERRQPIENGTATGAFDDAAEVLEEGARYRLAFRIGSSVREAEMATVDGSTLVTSGTGTVGISSNGVSQAICEPTGGP